MIIGNKNHQAQDKPDADGLNFYRYFDEQTIRNNISESSEYKNKIATEQAARDTAAADKLAAEQAAAAATNQANYN